MRAGWGPACVCSSRAHAGAGGSGRCWRCRGVFRATCRTPGTLSSVYRRGKHGNCTGFTYCRACGFLQGPYIRGVCGSAPRSGVATAVACANCAHGRVMRVSDGRLEVARDIAVSSGGGKDTDTEGQGCGRHSVRWQSTVDTVCVGRANASAICKLMAFLRVLMGWLRQVARRGVCTAASIADGPWLTRSVAGLEWLPSCHAVG